MTKVNKFRKTFVLFIIGFIILIFMSEAIYIIVKKPSRLIPYYLARAKFHSQKENIQLTLKYLGKASEIKLKDTDQKYPDISMKIPQYIPDIPDNDNLNNALKAYLKSIEYDSLGNSWASKWAGSHYQLGLLSYNNSELDLVIPFWETALNLAPEWSYFHVELANFHLIQGDSDKARERIEFCLMFRYPKNHCKEFLEENIQTNTPEPVGSWEAEINAI